MCAALYSLKKQTNKTLLLNCSDAFQGINTWLLFASSTGSFQTPFRKYMVVVLLIGKHNSEPRQWIASLQGFATSSCKSTWHTQLPGHSIRGSPCKCQGHAHIHHFTVHLLFTRDGLVTCPGCIPISHPPTAALGSRSPGEPDYG